LNRIRILLLHPKAFWPSLPVEHKKRFNCTYLKNKKRTDKLFFFHVKKLQEISKWTASKL